MHLLHDRTLMSVGKRCIPVLTHWWPGSSLTGFTYPIKPAIPLTRRHFGLPQGKRLYLCPNQHYKFHPKFDELILRVLDADPGGMAVLITTRGAAHLAPLLLERLGRNRGSAWVRERIVVLPTTGVEYNLNRHYPDLVLAADVVLDSYPYGGATSPINCHCHNCH